MQNNGIYVLCTYHLAHRNNVSISDKSFADSASSYLLGTINSAPYSDEFIKRFKLELLINLEERMKSTKHTTTPAVVYSATVPVLYGVSCVFMCSVVVCDVYWYSVRVQRGNFYLH